MKTNIVKQLKLVGPLLLGLCAGACFIPTVHAGGSHQRPAPIHIHGYQVYTNVGTINPANPIMLEVRTGGEGGVSHLGKLRSWSTDQTVNLATGELRATYTFEDERGDQFRCAALGASAFQPDGRVTFAGEFTVLGGTGKFRHAHGMLRFEGWARTTDYATGAGIGFGTIDGIIRGTTIAEDKPFTTANRGTATFNGADFVFNGSGVATRVGRYENTAYNTAGPFNGAFVGIVGGKFTLAWSTAEHWTTRNGDELHWSGIEFVYFEVLTLPDGTLAPDFSKPSTGVLYHVVEGGSGRFAHAQGVMFTQGAFVMANPPTIAAQLSGAGFLSRCDD